MLSSKSPVGSKKKKPSAWSQGMWPGLPSLFPKLFGAPMSLITHVPRCHRSNKELFHSANTRVRCCVVKKLPNKVLLYCCLSTCVVSSNYNNTFSVCLRSRPDEEDGESVCYVCDIVGFCVGVCEQSDKSKEGCCFYPASLMKQYRA